MAHQEKKKGWFHKGTGKTFLIKEGLCAFLNITNFQFNQMLANGEIIATNKLNRTKTNTNECRKPVTVEYQGIVYNSYKDLCDALNLSRSTFASRIRKGWSVEDAIEKGVKKYVRKASN
jgi:hypothetical protein